MVYALDAAEGEIIEPDYIDVIEEVFPGIKDGQISPQWTSGAPDAANPKTHGYITKIALNLLRGDNASAKSFYSGYLPTLVRGSVLPDSDELTDLLITDDNSCFRIFNNQFDASLRHLFIQWHIKTAAFDHSEKPFQCFRAFIHIDQNRLLLITFPN